MAPASVARRGRDTCAPSGLCHDSPRAALLSSTDRWSGARSQTQACQERWFDLGIRGRGRDSVLLDLHEVCLEAVQRCAFCLAHPRSRAREERPTHGSGVSGTEGTQHGGPNSSPLQVQPSWPCGPPARGPRLREQPRSFGHLPLLCRSQNSLWFLRFASWSMLTISQSLRRGVYLSLEGESDRDDPGVG